jgi:carbon storage regulator
MLVLSRRQHEQIVFPELGITIEVVRLQGNSVRLGIKAPDSVRIKRGELAAIDRDFQEPASHGLPITMKASVTPVVAEAA